MTWTLWTAGFVVIGIAVAMLVVARPADGHSAPFLKNWLVGQLYAISTMVCIIMGVSLVIMDWPF